MRTCRWAIAGLLLVTVACRPVNLPPAAGEAPTLASAISTPTLPGDAAPAVAPTAILEPAASPAVLPAVEGPLTANGQALTSLSIAPGSALVRYGATAAGLVRSDDGGDTWQQAANMSLPPLLVSPTDPHALYSGAMASCYKDEEPPPFRRSEDGGLTWEDMPAGRGIQPVAEGPQPHRALFGISCPGMNISLDGGQTWELSGPTEGMEITSLIPTDRGRFSMLAVLTSEGGTSHLAWFDEQGKLRQFQGPSFWGRGVLAGDGSYVYVADSTGVWRNSGGEQWDLFKDGLAGVVLAFDPLTQGFPADVTPDSYGLFALAIDPANPQRLALGTVRGLYVSLDRGEHWQPAGLPALEKSRIADLAWDPGAPNTLYATTPEGVYLVRLP